MMGKASAILGPALVGVTAAVTGDSRLSILSIVILFIGGGILLTLASRKGADTAGGSGGGS
jgi:UMF1 family MFS transporter